MVLKLVVVMGETMAVSSVDLKTCLMVARLVGYLDVNLVALLAFSMVDQKGNLMVDAKVGVLDESWVEQSVGTMVDMMVAK